MAPPLPSTLTLLLPGSSSCPSLQKNSSVFNSHMPSHFETVPHILLPLVTPEPVNSWLGLSLHLASQEGRAATSSLHLLGHSPDARGVCQGWHNHIPYHHQLQLTEDGEGDGGVLEVTHAVTRGAQVVTGVRPVMVDEGALKMQKWRGGGVNPSHG